MRERDWQAPIDQEPEHKEPSEKEQRAIFARELYRQPLGVAQMWHNNALISGEDFKKYLHAWQTGAPRFGARQCHCDSCKIQYPSPEY